MSRVYRAIKAHNITCDVCNKPIDEVVTQYCVLTAQNLFAAKCHGEIDRCEVDREFIEQVADGVLTGRAFTTKRLEHDDNRHKELEGRPGV